MSEILIGILIGVGVCLFLGFIFYRIMNSKFEILTQKNSLNFREQASLDLQGIIAPLNERVKEYKSYMDELHRFDLKDRENLRSKMQELNTSADKIEHEAKTLSQALSKDIQFQGNWGEIVLERILELSGLIRDQDFFTQTSFTEDGKNLRPDIVIKLPNKSDIIIDSKVSLKSYYNYIETKDESELLNLKKSITSHIDSLSKKDYSNIADLNSPEFVYLFIPLEGVFSLVVKEFGELVEIALKKNIILVSPLNLTASLKTVASLWRLEKQSQNAELMASKAGAMYDKFALLVQDIEGIGTSLTKALNHKESVMRKLSEGNGNLVSRAQELKSLGAKTTKELP